MSGPARCPSAPVPRQMRAADSRTAAPARCTVLRRAVSAASVPVDSAYNSPPSFSLPAGMPPFALSGYRLPDTLLFSTFAIPFTGHEGCHCVPAQKILRMKKTAAGVFRLRQRSAVSEFSVFRCGWWLPCSALRGRNIPSAQCNSRSGGRTPPGWRRRARSSLPRTSGCTLQ